MLYKFMMGESGGLSFWKAQPEWHPSWYPGATLAGEITPEYLGVGYIIGTRVAGLMFAGGVVSWLVLIPLFKFLGAHVQDAIYPGTMRIAQMTPLDVWKSYIRYIGAGAVTMAGVITLGRTIPTITSAFSSAFRQLRQSSLGKHVATERTARDLPLSLVAAGSLLMVIGVWVLLAFRVNPGARGNLASSILIILFGFFFATVSARIAGLLGSSSNPISGMTIATLVAVCLIFSLIGWTSNTYAAVALSIGAVVCISAATGGATTQDLKTGFLVGATPSYQEIGLAVGALTSVFVIGLTLSLLNRSATRVNAITIPNVEVASDVRSQGSVSYNGREYQVLSALGSRTVPDGRYYYDPAAHRIDYQEVPGIGSADYPAPQATLMSVVINGILTRKLPWTLLLFGAFIVVALEICGVRSLAFAVGSYLPISTTATIFAGGVVKWLAQKATRAKEEESEAGSGALFSSGLIAGGSLGGLALAAVVGFKKEGAFAIGTRFFPAFAQSDLAALLIFLALTGRLFFVAATKRAVASGK